MQFRLNQLSRRTVLQALLAGGIVVAVNAGGLVSPGRGAEVADLQDRLEKDLRALTPKQFDFIERVVAAVENDVLPRSIVDSTYLWARKKPRNRFQYFEEAIRLRTKRLGIDI